MINIFVIDDHPVFIDGLRSIFDNREDRIKISGWAYSAKEALPKLKRSKAQVVLLDLVMPEFSGVEFCLLIKKQFPEKKVIALTGELNANLLYNTWLNMADAILMKYCGKEELLETIYAVLAGRRVLGKDVPEFYDQLRASEQHKPYLTRTEMQILNLLAKGHKRQEVSDLLGSNLNAVNFHCKNLFKKFDKNNLLGVVEAARKAKLI